MESDKGIQCKACDWPVAHNASECMRCGYDYAGERAFEAEKARVQRQELFSTISISIIAVFCGALVLADKSGFGFQASLLILICGVAVLWLGLRYISIKIIAWLEERKK
ncbi:MAG: membrane protein required for beta-lactamase induction [Zhongshania marina]|jgi:membrane protein required for beta-lactamase induction